MSALMLHRVRVASAGLVQQVLQRPTILKRASDLGFEVVGNVEDNATAFDPAIQHVAGVLVATRAGGAVVADARAASKTQRPQGRGPQVSRLCAEPTFNIRWRFNFGWRFTLTRHVGMYAILHTYMSREIVC